MHLNAFWLRYRRVRLVVREYSADSCGIAPSRGDARLKELQKDDGERAPGPSLDVSPGSCMGETTPASSRSTVIDAIGTGSGFEAIVVRSWEQGFPSNYNVIPRVCFNGV